MDIDFKQCMFYPAGGTDLQVLLRYSDIFQTVISPNLSAYLSPEQYEIVFRDKCDYLNKHYGEELLVYEGRTDIDTSFIERNLLLEDYQDIFDNADYQGYVHAFHNSIQADRFCIQYHFTRKIGGISRSLSWIAMNTEGMATLLQLSRLYQCFPGMILTIQSGVMETQGSIFSRLLEQLNADTPYWVRGFWRHNLMGTKIEDIISEPYGQVVQTYGYWYSAMGQKYLENEENKTKYYPNSIVKAYARKLPEVTDVYELFHPMNARRRARILKRNVWDEDLTRYDALFTSNALAAKHPECQNIICFESLPTAKPSRLFPPITLWNALIEIRKICSEKGYCTIGMTPIGYEDEGIAISNFILGDTADFTLDVYHAGALDFLSLKQGVSLLPDES